MAKVFTHLKPIKLSHSNFNLSYDNKFTCQFGQLIPVCCKEMLPGDVFRYNIESVVRLMPTISPLMHKIDIRIESFFVPNRIIWEDWEDFITGKDTTIVLPKIKLANIKDNGVGQLQDYFGCPTNFTPGVSTKHLPIKLPFLAYNKIYNTYYINPEIQQEIDEDNLDVQYRNWSNNDYFTSALPESVQGGINPTISQVLNDLPVVFDTRSVSDIKVIEEDANSSSLSVYDSGISDPSSISKQTGNRLSFARYNGAQIPLNINSKVPAVIFKNATYDSMAEEATRYFSPIVADAQNSGFSITADQLRRLFATEQFLERNARSGDRYVDQILARFNTFAGDSRLDRPEFLGSARSTIAIAEIPNTSGSSLAGSRVQGSLAGKGLGGLASRITKYRAKEHGYFITLMSVVPKLSYVSEGISKEFDKESRLDFFTPEFDHLGEVPVMQRELYYNGLNDDTAFGGYEPIYNEYRYSRDLITSGLKYNNNGGDTWHLGRSFDPNNLPLLNDDFLNIGHSLSEFNRIYPSNFGFFICDVYNDLSAYRPISKYGEPGLMHF